MDAKLRYSEHMDWSLTYNVTGLSRLHSEKLDSLLHAPLSQLPMSRCKNMEVPVDKIYNKTQREKFAWAIDMTEEDFLF